MKLLLSRKNEKGELKISNLCYFCYFRETNCSRFSRCEYRRFETVHFNDAIFSEFEKQRKTKIDNVYYFWYFCGKVFSFFAREYYRFGHVCSTMILFRLWGRTKGNRWRFEIITIFYMFVKRCHVILFFTDKHQDSLIIIWRSSKDQRIR